MEVARPIAKAKRKARTEQEQVIIRVESPERKVEDSAAEAQEVDSQQIEDNKEESDVDELPPAYDEVTRDVSITPQQASAEPSKNSIAEATRDEKEGDLEAHVKEASLETLNIEATQIPSDESNANPESSNVETKNVKESESKAIMETTLSSEEKKQVVVTAEVTDIEDVKEIKEIRKVEEESPAEKLEDIAISSENLTQATGVRSNAGLPVDTKVENETAEVNESTVNEAKEDADVPMHRPRLSLSRARSESVENNFDDTFPQLGSISRLMSINELEDDEGEDIELDVPERVAGTPEEIADRKQTFQVNVSKGEEVQEEIKDEAVESAKNEIKKETNDENTESKREEVKEKIKDTIMEPEKQEVKEEIKDTNVESKEEEVKEEIKDDNIEPKEAEVKEEKPEVIESKEEDVKAKDEIVEEKKPELDVNEKIKEDITKTTESGKEDKGEEKEKSNEEKVITEDVVQQAKEKSNGEKVIKEDAVQEAEQVVEAEEAAKEETEQLQHIQVEELKECDEENIFQQEEKADIARSAIYDCILPRVFLAIDAITIQKQNEELARKMEEERANELREVKATDVIVLDSADLQIVSGENADDNDVAVIVTPVIAINDNIVLSTAAVPHVPSDPILLSDQKKNEEVIQKKLEEIQIDTKISSIEPLTAQNDARLEEGEDVVLDPPEDEDIDVDVEEKNLQAEIASKARYDSATLMADLQPLTHHLDWISKDEKLRLESDLIALSVIKSHEERQQVERNEFKKKAQIHYKSEFYGLVKNFYRTERHVAAIHSRLRLLEKGFKSLSEKMWPRETKTLTQIGVGKKSNQEVKLKIEYETTWVSENDAKNISFFLNEESKNVLPDLTRKRFDERAAFLKVEMHLFDIKVDRKVPKKVRVEQMISCINVLFHYLKKPNKKHSRFHECVHKWIQILTSWIYKEGSSEDREFIFRHIIRTHDGIADHKHVPRFPRKMRKWTPDDSRHFLKIMYLLCCPIGVPVSAEEKRALKREDSRKENKRAIKREESRYMIKVKDILTNPKIEDAKKETETKELKNFKVSLREEDIIHLLNSLPIKEYLNHILLEACTAGVNGVSDWKDQAKEAIGTVQALMYMVGNAMEALPGYIRFKEQLCKVLCWTAQCLVDSYVKAKDGSKAAVNPVIESKQAPDSSEFDVFVQREIDWLTARCMALVNSNDDPDCRAYLCLFPLSHLSHDGADLVFQILFRGTPFSCLLDSGYKVQTYSFTSWQKRQTNNPDLRKNFFHSIASCKSRTRLVALNTLAESQEKGRALPIIWTREVFLAAFVDTETSPMLSMPCQPLIASLCTFHPEVISQLLGDINDSFFRTQTNPPTSKIRKEVQELIHSLELRNYLLSPKDSRVLQRFLETPNHFCFRVATSILDRYNYAFPLSIKEGKEGKISKDAEQLRSGAELILPLLGEVRLAYLVEQRQRGPRSLLPGPSLDWWCSTIAHISTHDITGNHLNPEAPAMFPSQNAINRLEITSDNALVRELVSTDPILKYISIVSIGIKDSLKWFISVGWDKILSLIKIGHPVDVLGYKALFSILPSFRAEASNFKMDIIGKILTEERRKHKSVSIGRDLVADLINSHFASLVIQEVIEAKKLRPSLPWNAIYAKNEEKEMKSVEIPIIKGDIIDFWLMQISNIRYGSSKDGTFTGTAGRGWLADHTCRCLMNDTISSLYLLTPKDEKHTLPEMVKFFQNYNDIHAKATSSNKREKGFEPPPSPLGAKPEINAKYPWLAFQIIHELMVSDSKSWEKLGILCLKKVQKGRPWKKVLKSEAPETHKGILWKSIIREWLRHAIHVEVDHPLLPAYWQQVFKLYFSRIEIATLKDANNPGKFYGFQFLLGTTGSNLVAKGLARLKVLAEYHERKKSERDLELNEMYLAMHQWLNVRPRTARAEVDNWATEVISGRNLTMEEKEFLESPCPTRNEEATCWRVNQLYIRAKGQMLPKYLCPDRLMSFFSPERIDRSRGNLWIDYGYTDPAIKQLKDSVTQYIPEDVFSSIFTSNKDQKLLPLDKKLNNTHDNASRAQRSRSLVLNSLRNSEKHVLILPPNLRRPIEESLGKDIMDSIRKGVEWAAKIYSNRSKLITETNLYVRQLLRRLYRNDHAVTNETRKTRGTILRSAEPVHFRVEHTKVVKVPGISQAMEKKRKLVIDSLAESEQKEIYQGHKSHVSDVCSKLILLQRITSFIVKALSDPKQDQEAMQDLGKRWLYAVVEMDGDRTHTYPISQDFVIPVIKKLCRFISVDIKSQSDVLTALQEHPRLVPELAPALQPIRMLEEKKGTFEDYCSMFGQACRMNIRFKKGENIRLVAVSVLQRFEVKEWLEMGPRVQDVVNLMTQAAGVLTEQYQFQTPAGISRISTQQYEKMSKLAIDFLVKVFATCSAYKFPKTFANAWTMLLKGAIEKPLAFPPSIWSAVASSPLEKLRWSKLMTAVKLLGTQVAQIKNVKSEEARAKGSENESKGESILYTTCGYAASEVLGFAKAMIIAGIKKLYRVRNKIESKGHDLTPKLIELMAASWGAFKPWLLERRATLNTKTVTVVWAVSQRFAELVGILCYPSLVSGNVDEKPLWTPSDALEQFWIIYMSKIAARSEASFLTYLNSCLRGEVQILPKPNQRERLPLNLLHLNGKQCKQSIAVLLSFWNHSSKEKARFRIQEVNDICSTFVSRTNWMEQLKPENKEAEEFALYFLVLVNHCSLVAKAPYSSEFSSLLRRLLHTDWEILTADKYDTVLEKTSELLYSKPGTPFNNTIMKILKPNPEMLPFLESCGDIGSVYAGINRDKRDSLSTMSAPPEFSSSTLGSAQVMSNMKISTSQPPSYSSRGLQSQQTSYQRAPTTGPSLRSPQTKSPNSTMHSKPMYARTATLKESVSRDANSTQSLSLQPPGYEAVQSASGTPVGSKSSPVGTFPVVSQPESKFGTLKNPNTISKNAPPPINSEQKLHRNPQNTLLAAKIVKKRAAEAKASAVIAQSLKEQKAEWLPAYRRDRAAFVLRFMMAMALGQSGNSQEMLKKTRSYAEWLLSVFRQSGPQPVTADVSWYINLAKQVLSALNGRAKSLLADAPREFLVDVINEYCTAINASELRGKDLQPLLNSLVSDYPHISLEIITALCRSETKQLVTKVESCISTMLKGADQSKHSSQRQLIPDDMKIFDLKSPTEAKSMNFRLTRRLVGRNGFGWILVGDAIKIEKSSISAYVTSAIQKGCVFALCGFAMKSLSQSVPASLRCKDAKSHDVTSAHSLLMKLSQSLIPITLQGVERSEGKPENIEAVEFGLVTLVRLILSAQAAIQKTTKGNRVVTQNANTLLYTIGNFLRKGEQHGKFGSSKMGRFGGRVAGFFGRKESGEELSPRFRLICRSLLSFMTLRQEQLLSSPKKIPTFSWSMKCLAPSRIQQKVLREFADKTKVKAYRNLSASVQMIEAMLGSSGHTLVEIDRFLSKIVADLYPKLKWPSHWCHPDGLYA